MAGWVGALFSDGGKGPKSMLSGWVSIWYVRRLGEAGRDEGKQQEKTSADVLPGVGLG